MNLKDKVLFITGGSRGIGLAIAKKAAVDGAKIAIAAKTAEPHTKLPGTIFTAAQEIEEAGGVALPLVCDVRSAVLAAMAIFAPSAAAFLAIAKPIPLLPPVINSTLSFKFILSPSISMLASII